MEGFLERQFLQEQLCLIICGHSGVGKSTLIGRLFWESGQIDDDQMAALHAATKKYRHQAQKPDLALYLDGLVDEREQGTTIDITYKFLSTHKRRLMVIDAPGQEQYTRNMVTGASMADLAILLVDAQAGLLPQTQRHALLCSTMGIRHLALLVNKMDLIAFDAQIFHHIKSTFETFAAPLGFESIIAVPISTTNGVNITERSPLTSWYPGPTLMGYLETVEIKQRPSHPMVFPVQWVNSGHQGEKGYSGTVAQGTLTTGDEIRVTASGQTASVAAIITMDGTLASARAGDAITLHLDREIEVSRGDVISLSQSPLEMTDQFEATLLWMHQDEGMAGRGYDLKLANQWSSAAITNIKYRINVTTLAHEASKKLQLNDISVCNIATTKPIVFGRFDTVPVLGRFILVDRLTHATVAAGTIRHSLRRAQNVHKQALSIARPDRERLNGHRGRVIWFTGLSGSGKSTVANALEVELHGRGMRTYLLDGDNVRQGLNKDLGFTEADRVENIRRIAEVAKLMMDAGLIVMTAFISPFKRDREMAKELVGPDNFIEVYVSTSLEICEQRDVKGLYKLARAGKIPNMTGINSPYEAPDAPTYVADSGGASVDSIVQDLVNLVSRE
ncbi:MAG: adenylyl-sulfate kinase [Magnetococcales bacterium]|nr:adenylyl-sulfate kinase [Magnetococcales bacterium]